MAFPAVTTTASNVARGQNGTTIGNLKPTGLAVGDLLIAAASAINGSNGNMTISAPATGSWNTIHTGTNTGLFWKIATSTETAASDIKPQFSGGTNSNDACGAFVLRITGGDTTTPVAASNFADVSGTALSTSGISPAIQSLFLIIDLATVADSVVRTLSGYAVVNNNPSWNEIIDNGISNSGTSSMHMAVATANETGTGGSATGNATATASLTEKATFAIIAVQPPKSFVASSIFVAATLGNAPIFIRKMIVATINVLAVLGVPTITTNSAKWKTPARSSSPWTGQIKS